MVGRNRKITPEETKKLSKAALTRNEGILRALADYDKGGNLPPSRLWSDILTPKVRFTKNFGSGNSTVISQLNSIDAFTGQTIADKQLDLGLSVSV